MSKSTKSKTKQPEPDRDAETNVSPEEVEALRAKVEELEAQLAEASDARQRALADFMNYQKRAMVNEREAREEGVGRVVESLLTVADYLDMALKQDPDRVSAKAVMDGVWLIREELNKVFLEHGVTPIRPNTGEEPNPARHDAMGHEAAEGVDPGHITRIEQHGYELAGRVLRPAKVYVAPQSSSDDAAEE
jgi:molecular chaperone GrpE